MRTFTRLLLMEIENVWRFPTPEIVIATAIVIALGTANPIISETAKISSYVSTPNWGATIIFLYFIIPTLAARSLAKGLGSNEMRVLLSYPVKRWETLLAKVAVVSVPTFAIFASAFLFNAFYIYQIPALNIMPYNLLIFWLLPTLFITALSFSISLLTRDELKTVLISLFTLLFLEVISDRLSSPYKYISMAQGLGIIKDYLLALYLGRTANFFKNQTIADVQTAFAFPLITAAILVLASFLYFQFKLDID
jgi:ABC-type transport system involved in multi-copper enzyme maturation permease subunit